MLSHLINGLSLGSVYAIIALGYTMVYGIAKMLNFAHGDVIMVGGFISFFAMANGYHPVIAILLAMLVCTILGGTIEKLAYKPLREAPSLAVLITAIGVSTILQQTALRLWGPNPKVYTSVVPSINYSLFGSEARISLIAIVTISTCIVIMTLLTLFINRAKTGKAMRACSEDKGAAQLMGISVDSTISVTFLIGAALAGIAGCLFCSMYTIIQPTTGAMPGIKAFTAAVFGGIGSVPGAMLGGILLGVIEIFGKAYISTQLSDAIVFLVLIIILLIKPSGLLGKKIMEKV
jgi:branched-chain amino acid transport system permease protein